MVAVIIISHRMHILYPNTLITKDAHFPFHMRETFELKRIMNAILHGHALVLTLTRNRDGVFPGS